MERVDEWLGYARPDVLLMQETKMSEDQFPHDHFAQLGYESVHFGEGRWNGVAILSKTKLEITYTSIPKFKDPNSRIIETEIKLKKIKKKIKLINIYLPNGNPIETEKFDYKIKWMKKFNDYIEELKSNNIPIIIAGDFNVIPTDDDVYSPENYKNDACAHPLTREQYRILINMGFTDLVKYFVEGKTNWTFWGYRGGGWQKGNGLRIDHFLTTANVTDLIRKVEVNREPRGWEKASDHTPVTITLEN